MKSIPALVLLALAATACFAAQPPTINRQGFAFETEDYAGAGVDSFGRPYIIVEGDTIHASYLPNSRLVSTAPLTNEDYRRVADSLGVEPAAIKAVASIEAGASRRGFYDLAKPVINFDLSVFRNFAKRNGINLNKYAKSHAVVFNRPNISRYGSYQQAQRARLDGAMSIDSITAIYGTFWGMFQLGGFNWKRCGASSPAEFVERMSTSEQQQLEMFANFIRNSGLLPALQKKEWATFARGYNGPGYAARGYHTRMAAAYNKFKKEFE